MFRRLFFIFFIINIRTSSCAIEALYEAGQQVWKLYTIIDNKGLNISYNAEANDPFSNNPIIRELKKQVDEIQGSLNQLEKFMGPKKILKTIKLWEIDAPTIREIETIELFARIIDEYYTKFNDYRNKNHRSHSSFETLMKDILLALEGDIIIIRKFVTNEEKTLPNKPDLVDAIAGYAVFHAAEICGTPQVISNILIQLFQMIIIAELKTCTMLAYDNIYGYVMNDDKSGWQNINSLAKAKLEEQFAIYTNIFLLHMASIDGVYNRACDPLNADWIRDESFYELERTFQATIFGYNWSNCKSESCNDIMTGEIRQCLPSFYEKPVLKSSEDTIAECRYLSHIRACVLRSGPYKFYYVNSGELGFLGINSSCPEYNGHLIESSVTANGVYAACACNAYRTHNKISLSIIESDMTSNQVITGLRFVRKNKVLYIQLRQGILAPNGYIDEDSQSWIPIPEHISLVMEPINKENRVFFLDNLTLPPTYVLTGVKFNKVTRESVPGFAIEIFGTHFDYTTGKLSLEGDFRQSRKGSNEKAGKKLLFNALSSAFTTLPQIVSPLDTKYVSLERSTLEDDFGQSTLPIFDAIPVTFGVPSALGGVGIFHKGVDGYAGLISLRVYGIKYEKYFNDFKLSHIINDRVSFNSSLQSM